MKRVKELLEKAKEELADYQNDDIPFYIKSRAFLIETEIGYLISKVNEVIAYPEYKERRIEEANSASSLWSPKKKTS